MSKRTLSLRDLKRLCAEWQTRLRLQDWKIDVFICREREFHTPKSHAEIVIYHDRKDATLRMLDPMDFAPDVTDEQDMELSLVHELVHIHLTQAKPRSVRGEEIAVNCITEALINFKRAGSKTRGGASVRTKQDMSAIADREGGENGP